MIFNDYLKSEPIAKCVYRGIHAPKGKNRFDIARSYELGRQYLWPCFVSTTANKNIAYDFMKENSKEGALFIIKLNENHYLNKRNIQKMSQFFYEEEILLFPYFNFIVKEIYPSTEPGNRFPIIELEEIDNALYRQIVWADKSVNFIENKFYQSIISGFCLQLQCFSDEEQCLKYFTERKAENSGIILIISGKMSQTIVEKIHSFYCLHQIFIFAYLKEKYEPLKEKYNKIVQIENDIVLIINRLNPSTE